MNVVLPPEQMEWLRSEVEAGHYASIDEAISAAVAGLMTARLSDLAWAEPFVRRARESFARGDVISSDEFSKRLSRKVETLKAQ